MRQQASASVAMSLTQDLESLAGKSEIAVLESWLDHELRCESTHDCMGRATDGGCSVVVTHLAITKCGDRKFICSNRAAFLVVDDRLSGRYPLSDRCYYCKGPSHRSITPL